MAQWGFRCICLQHCCIHMTTLLHKYEHQPSSSKYERQPSSSSFVDENGGSYVCSMSADVDLSSQGSDLVASVNSYLSRIVEELHLISRWSTECNRQVLACHQLQQNQQIQQPTPPKIERQPSSGTRLSEMPPMVITSEPQQTLVQAQLELFRQEMHRSQQALFLQWSEQVAQVQHSFRFDRDDHLKEVQSDFEAKLRFFTQETVMLMNSQQEERDTRIKALETSAKLMHKQSAEDRRKLVDLEASSRTATSAHAATLFTQQNEMSALQRRIDHIDAALALQLQELRTVTEDALQSVRASQHQISSKLQVLRLEVHEHEESVGRKLQQMIKQLNRKPGSDDPVSASNRTIRATKMPEAGSRNFPNGVKISTGSAAMTTLDSFLYAKAALPLRDGLDVITKKPVVQPISAGTRGFMDAMDSASRSESATFPGAEFGDLLTVQQSQLSPPLGREEDDYYAHNGREFEPSDQDAQRADDLFIRAPSMVTVKSTSSGSAASNTTTATEDNLVKTTVPFIAASTISPRKFHSSRLLTPSSSSSPRVTTHRPHSRR